VIEEVTNLTLFLVTKRIGNVAKMVPERWMREGFPAHVHLIITVVNKEEAERDIPKLLALPCRNGVSYEPAIGAVDWEPWLGPCEVAGGIEDGFRTWNARGIEWLIVGGESDQAGHKTRPFDLKWAQTAIAQCRAAGVAVFIKQIGSTPISRQGGVGIGKFNVGWPIKDRAGADPAEWPEDLRVQEFPT
jgi:protein gp37